MDVAPVGGHGVLALGQTADDRKAHIEEGHAQDQERDHEGDHRVHLEQALDGDGGQHEAQEGGAGVAHEDLGGVEVIGDEADAGTQQRRQHHGDTLLPQQQGDDQHGGGGDAADANGQAVQTVDEVDGVGHQHNPEDRHGTRHPAQVKGHHGEGIGHIADLAAVEHHDGACGDLGE